MGVEEEWKVIPSLPKYEASTLGRIRNRETGSIRTLAINNKGYPVLSVWDSEKRKPAILLAHRLICETFRGPCPEGYECAHMNGTRAEIHLANLEWVTAKENHAHRLIHGTDFRSGKSPTAKLSMQNVKDIKTAYADGCSQHWLARYFNISQASIWSAIHGHSYQSDCAERKS